MRKPKGAGDWMALFTGLIGLAVLLGMLGGGIYLLVKGIHDHKGGTIFGGAFLALLGGALPLFLAGKLGEGLLRRAVPGARPPAIAVELQRNQVAPGETLGGHVKVSEGGRARKLTVALCCRDRTADYTGTSQEQGLQTLASGALTVPAELPFSIAVPTDAPPSYSAGAISIWWEVEARCDVFGTDVKANARVEITTPAPARASSAV